MFASIISCVSNAFSICSCHGIVSCVSLIIKKTKKV